MSTPISETIAAIATAPGTAGVGIIRISGPEAWAIASRCVRLNRPLQPWRVQLGWARSAPDDNHQAANTAPEDLDQALVLAFRAPKSFTGEDVVELHLHGGPFVLQAALRVLLDAGAVLAGPGAFTQRAFLNGKLDLTQAEAIADVLAAQGQRALVAATHTLKTQALAQWVDAWRQQIIAIQAPIVAATDFPDEVDEPERAPLIAALQAQASALADAVAQAKTMRRLQQGRTVVLLGQPNAGKSTLFNTLVCHERAIVTPIAGTTRDTLQETLMLEGVPVTLTDTAGLREQTPDAVEQLGISRSWAACHSADAVLFLVDSTTLTGQDVTGAAAFPPADREALQALHVQCPQTPVAIVLTKTDQRKVTVQAGASSSLGLPLLPVVAVQGAVGIQPVMTWLQATLIAQGESASPAATQQALVALNERQVSCLTAVQSCLDLAATTLANPHCPLDMTTVPLSEALYHIDVLTGRVTTEEVLDAVFSQFCVGK